MSDNTRAWAVTCIAVCVLVGMLLYPSWVASNARQACLASCEKDAICIEACGNLASGACKGPK